MTIRRIEPNVRPSRGATAIPGTRVAVRSRMDVPDRLKENVRQRVSASLAPHATRVERVTVRFDDVNGPKGGIDVDCEVKVSLGGLPPVVVTERAATPGLAFTSALRTIVRTVRKELDRHGFRAKRPGARSNRAGARKPRAATARMTDPTPLIGRDVGMGPEALARALERPEKSRRDALVNTAATGVSASDRRAGGDHSARRNSRASREGMTVALEDSVTRPSRKSTRRSVNGGKPSQGKERNALAQLVKPSTRAARRPKGAR